MLGKLLCEIRLLLKKRSAVRNDQTPEAGKFQDEFAHDGGVQPSTSSTTPTLISDTEALVLIFDKTYSEQGPQTTLSTAIQVPGICDSKSSPVKSCYANNISNKVQNYLHILPTPLSDLL